MSKEKSYTALLGDSTTYTGKLSFSGAVRIDGKFSGDIDSDGKLVLGKDACFQGTVRVSELVVRGNVSGDLFISGRTVLHQTARVTGNLATKLLIMEEGAELSGSLQMGAEAEKIVSEAVVAVKDAEIFVTESPKQ